MRNLNVQGFINEMSYKLTMQELEEKIVEYQDVIIDYIVNNQYNFKARKEFSELCDVLRQDKCLQTIIGMALSDDSRLDFDMAYVLYTITNFNNVDESVKNLANEAAYYLREVELGNVVEDVETNTLILIGMSRIPYHYNSTPFLRSKYVENILKDLPDMLYNAYGKRFSANKITKNTIYGLLRTIVKDVQVDEIITAFGKMNFPTDLRPEVEPYAIRLRTFIFDLCGAIDATMFRECLNKICDSINKFNKRNNLNETLFNKYLSFQLLEAFVVDSIKKNFKISEASSRAYQVMNMYRLNNQQYEYLFEGAEVYERK